ncbi:MAG: hypothetical protein QNJ90_04165 [Planctomycetota bacterium]|nr:hypothetical protein [Planctomycetota bacterium]
MPPALLYWTYLVVMTAGLVCFVQAYRTRFVTPVHKRWGITGTVLSLTGIVVVLVGAWLGGWRVEERLPDVVAFHRQIAYVGTALLLLTAVTGALRMPLHKRLYIVFLPVYVVVLVTAIIGYRP